METNTRVPAWSCNIDWGNFTCSILRSLYQFYPTFQLSTPYIAMKKHHCLTVALTMTMTMAAPATVAFSYYCNWFWNRIIPISQRTNKCLQNWKMLFLPQPCLLNPSTCHSSLIRHQILLVLLAILHTNYPSSLSTPFLTFSIRLCPPYAYLTSIVATISTVAYFSAISTVSPKLKSSQITKICSLYSMASAL